VEGRIDCEETQDKEVEGREEEGERVEERKEKWDRRDIGNHRKLEWESGNGGEGKRANRGRREGEGGRRTLIARSQRH